jgi:iron complex transport system ATP-binding protein
MVTAQKKFHINTLLEVKNLTLTIGKKTLCRDLNFEVLAGQTWGILGPNGSGKTTLLHTIAGLHKSKGNIKVQSKPLEAIPKRELAKTLGISLQETHDVFPQTVYESCSLGRYPHLDFFSYESEMDKQIILKALSDMGLMELCHQTIQTLSGGERRRLTLATLIAQAPLLYLLDEPTNHLDIYHQISILRYFNQQTEHSNTSVIMSLHDINLAAQFCDHILMIFKNGDYLAGPASLILQTDHLSRLYQYPITKICQHFIPTFEN